jgi:hypothetical protein
MRKLNLNKLKTNNRYKMVKIERVNVSGLKSYNTCNLPKDAKSDGPHHLDYETEVRRTELRNYIHLTNYIELKISANMLAILKEYNNNSWKTGRLWGELNELWEQEAELDASGLFDGRRWFFRFSSNSPKDGTPDYPVVSAKDVLEKIATSARASFSLERGERSLFFAPFHDDWDTEDEFRVFIHNNKVTAISTYKSAYTNYSEWNDIDLKELAKKIIDFQQSTDFELADSFPASYIMDVRFSGTAIELIEFNSFGYWLAGGSALFEWINDYDILYGDGSAPIFRLANME